MTHAQFDEKLWELTYYAIEKVAYGLNPKYSEDEKVAAQNIYQTIEELMTEFDARTARIVELENEIELMRYTWPVVTQTQIETGASILEETNDK